MRVRYGKWALAVWFLFLSLIATFSAMAEAMPEETGLPLPAPFVGYYEGERRIRVAPRASTDQLVSIPASTPVYLTPVNDKYAETRYEGITGYVFYEDAIPAVGVNTPVEPYVAYSDQIVPAYADPHASGDVMVSFPAYMPLEIAEEYGLFAVITQEEGVELYIPLRLLIPLGEDEGVPAYRAYLSGADVLYRFPLPSAPVDMVLPMGTEVLVSATNGEYAYVTLGTDSGYVLLPRLSTTPVHKASGFFAYAPFPTVLYQEPSIHAYTERYVDVGVILEIDGAAGAFLYVKNLDAYVPADLVKKLEVSTLKKPFAAYWETEQPLYQSAHSGMALAGLSLAPNTLVDIRYSFLSGKYHLIQVDGQWGFISKTDMITIQTTKHAKASFYIAQKGIATKISPIPDGAEGQALSKGKVFKVSESFNGFVKMEDEQPVTYVAFEDLEQVEDAKRVSRYEAYISTDAQALDIPHGEGTEIGTITGNRLVYIGQQNSGYAYVSAGKVKGYVSLQSVRKLSNPLENQEEIQNYYIFLNKASREMTVYYADEEGNRTDRVARATVMVAIGKKTTPTPSGIFKLGGRERWHHFGEDYYAPFTIEFSTGRYLHGPVYDSPSESGGSTLREFGRAATGGCIRTPYDDMLWIYCHCMKDNTVLEIVNGV